MDASAFARLAPALQNPLTLIGFCLFLVFGVFRALIRSKILPTVDSVTGASILSRLLHYGFILSILIIFLGFAFAYRTTTSTDDKATAPVSAKVTGEKSFIIQGENNRVSIIH